MNKLKIALVKQEVYQDLYVCSHEEHDPARILFSSHTVTCSVPFEMVILTECSFTAAS